MAIEGVDVCFIPQIPTLSEWGLIAMAGILGNSRIYGYEKKESNCISLTKIKFKHLRGASAPFFVWFDYS